MEKPPSRTQPLQAPGREAEAGHGVLGGHSSPAVSSFQGSQNLQESVSSVPVVPNQTPLQARF